MADVIVTASDEKYFPLLQDLVLSFNQNISNSDTDFCVLDLGLTPTQLEWLSGRIHKVRAADWDFDFDFLESTPSRFKGFTVKSFLPRYFPGYRHYIWIDADAWIQSAEAIDLLIAGASTGAMAVVPELDRSYPSSVSRAKVRTFSSIPLLHGSIRGLRTWMRTGSAGVTVGRSPTKPCSCRRSTPASSHLEVILPTGTNGRKAIGKLESGALWIYAIRLRSIMRSIRGVSRFLRYPRGATGFATWRYPSGTPRTGPS